MDTEDVTHWSRTICNPISQTSKAVLMLIGMNCNTGICHIDARTKWIPKSCIRFEENDYYIKDDFINQFFEKEITKFVR